MTGKKKKRIMKNSVVLINPNSVTQKRDYFGSGIPYWPITLAYIAGVLKKYKIPYEVIDMFGEKPTQIIKIKDKLIQGSAINQLLFDMVSRKSKYIIICPNNVFCHERTLVLIKWLKEEFPKKKIIVVQNIHNVVAYDITQVKKQFFKYGADIIIKGEPENQIAKLFKKKPIDVLKLMPDWSKFPLENYWKLGYAHAPYKGRYMPIITSRGCPGRCNFCINPTINKSNWRQRSAKNVIKEIKQYLKKYNINEIHISDLNPTVDKDRIQSIFFQTVYISDIQFKFVTGIKIDFINSYTLQAMKSGGCSYLSFSPESGSERVLKLINKHFDFEHGRLMTELMYDHKITSQACFVIGYPGENKKDRKLTRKYIYKLVKAGIDEIALFIFAPMVGAKAYKLGKWNFDSLSDLTFSPKWRKEYKELNRWRWNTYLLFFIWKLIYHPFSYLRFKKTKMYNTIKRVWKIRK